MPLPWRGWDTFPPNICLHYSFHFIGYACVFTTSPVQHFIGSFAFACFYSCKTSSPHGRFYCGLAEFPNAGIFTQRPPLLLEWALRPIGIWVVEQPTMSSPPSLEKEFFPEASDNFLFQLFQPSSMFPMLPGRVCHGFVSNKWFGRGTWKHDQSRGEGGTCSPHFPHLMGCLQVKRQFDLRGNAHALAHGKCAITKGFPTESPCLKTLMQVFFRMPATQPPSSETAAALLWGLLSWTASGLSQTCPPRTPSSQPPPQTILPFPSVHPILPLPSVHASVSPPPPSPTFGFLSGFNRLHKTEPGRGLEFFLFHHKQGWSEDVMPPKKVKMINVGKWSGSRIRNPFIVMAGPHDMDNNEEGDRDQSPEHGAGSDLEPDTPETLGGDPEGEPIQAHGPPPTPLSKVTRSREGVLMKMTRSGRWRRLGPKGGHPLHPRSGPTHIG